MVIEANKANWFWETSRRWQALIFEDGEAVDGGKDMAGGRCCVSKDPAGELVCCVDGSGTYK